MITTNKPTVEGWIAIETGQPVRIAQIRQLVYGAVADQADDAELYELEPFAHISLLGFEADHVAAATIRQGFNETLRRTIEDPLKIDSDGVYFYPSRENPMVVAVDVDFSRADHTFEELLENAEDLVTKNGGTVTWRSPRPHVTLIKAGDEGDENTWGELSDESHERLLEHAESASKHVQGQYLTPIGARIEINDVSYE